MHEHCLNLREIPAITFNYADEISVVCLFVCLIVCRFVRLSPIGVFDKWLACVLFDWFVSLFVCVLARL